MANNRAGTHDRRGNNKDRAARKHWMLTTFGDGTNVPCVHCHASLTFDTVEADRIVPGGSYRRDNVQPSCGSCNKARSNNIEWAYTA